MRPSRADFQTLMFPGSKRLFEIADSISEIKSICRCGRKATVNARLDAAGNIITEGDQVCLGGNDKYVPGAAAGDIALGDIERKYKAGTGCRDVEGRTCGA